MHKEQLIEALKSLNITVQKDKIKRSDIIAALTKVLAKESDPSLKAPKEWWDEMHKEVKKGNPDYSEKKIRETIGDIWANKLTDAKRKEIRKRYGKKYGKAP